MCPNPQLTYLWILDYGATDHITFEVNDYSQSTEVQRNFVVNTNDCLSLVTGAGDCKYNNISLEVLDETNTQHKTQLIKPVADRRSH